MTRLLNLTRWWLLLKWPPARSVCQGMADGQAGLTPQCIDEQYYMAGYRDGRARLVKGE